MKMTRRTFGQAAFAGAAALSTAAESDRPPGWIDAHVHIWNPDVTKYPLGSGFKKSDMQPPSFTAEELFRHCRPAGVARVVLIQMSFYQYDHSYMLEQMHTHPGVFSGVALIDHQSDDLTQRMEMLASQGVRGFRIHSPAGARLG